MYETREFPSRRKAARLPHAAAAADDGLLGCNPRRQSAGSLVAKRGGADFLLGTNGLRGGFRREGPRQRRERIRLGLGAPAPAAAWSAASNRFARLVSGSGELGAGLDRRAPVVGPRHRRGRPPERVEGLALRTGELLRCSGRR